MSLATILFIAFGLSMDAFAVSLSSGMERQHASHRDAAVMALFFGGFQAGMPLIGWVAGRKLQYFLGGIDHWIALLILTGIGVKMMWESFSGLPDGEASSVSLRTLFMLAIATSIDALAVGVTLAFIRVPLLFTVAVIGSVTFLLSFLGVELGRQAGRFLPGRAEFAGGVVLVVVGLKIFLEHTSVL